MQRVPDSVQLTKSNTQILLVDDDIVDIMAVKRAFRVNKIENQVHVAHDGIEALQMLRERPTRIVQPYVILLDLNMPRMNGVEFLRELRADPEHNQSTVFVLTTSQAEADVVAVREQGVAGYIVKSSIGGDMAQLVRLLDEAQPGRAEAERNSVVSPIRVLLVDDDEVDRASVARLLRASTASGAIRLEYAHSAEAASNTLTKNAFDCVLLDYRLPDGDALSLLSDWQSAETFSTPVVVLTGVAEEGVALEALKKGAQDFLVKGSFSGEVLLRSIRYSIGRFRIQEQLERANEQLERLAILDPLTEMLNRRGLEQVLLAELDRAAKEGLPLFALLLDCDDFKSVNDNFGHHVGDRVLREISYRVRAAVRHTDHVGRLGGDEFLVLLPGAQRSEAVLFAERLRHAVCDQPVIIGASVIQKTVSQGVFAVPSDTRSITELLAHGHSALRRSKRTGKNRVSESGFTAVNRGHVQNETPADLAEREDVRVFRQSIVRLHDGQEIGTEFFVQGPKGFLEKADEFFFHFLQQRTLTAVDLRCFRECIAATSRFATGNLHLNIYGSTLLESNINHVLDMLPTHGSDGTLCIEVSVQHMSGDPQKLRPIRNALREAGVRLALDQANFGRATLEALIVLEPDLVKIDRSLINSADSRTLGSLERLTRAAQILHAQLVAVGIEHSSDLEVLQKLGVELGQGFLWGLPSEVHRDSQ